MRYLFIFWVGVMVGCTPPVEKSLIIGVASSASYPLTEIKNEFEKKYGEKVTLIFGSSGKLAAQIEQGSPIDILVSADMTYPNYLYEKNWTTVKPRIYATGKLAIFGPKRMPSISLSMLEDPMIKHIAIANPEVAPYGRAAMEYLQKNKIADKIKSKLVFGDNVSQTAQFVLSGNADVGITALSILKTPNIENKLIYQVINDYALQGVEHGFVLIQNNDKRKQEIQEKFSTFLQSDFAQKILAKYGFS